MSWRGPGYAWGPLDWTWCLDLLQPFDSLLQVAGTLAVAQQRPGEEQETGSLLLNLYLVSCALAQLAGDHRHRRFPHPMGLRLRRRERELRSLSQSLAAAVLKGELTCGHDAGRAVARLCAASWPAGLRRRHLVVPASVRGVDLYPQDCRLLAERAARVVDDAGAPVLVVGLHPDGYYLGPLCAAALVEEGYGDVLPLPLRPGASLLRSEAAQVRAVAGAGGWALVLGATDEDAGPFAEATGALAALGLTPARIAWAARARAGRPAEPVGPWGRCAAWALLQPDEGHVYTVMADEEIERWLNQPPVLARLGADEAVVLGGAPFPSGTPVPAAPCESSLPAPGGPSRRLHALKLFEVQLRRDRERWVDGVLARGAGLGFFGYHSWLVAACLGDRVPEVLGMYEGVLLTRWEPADGPVEPLEPEDLDAVAAYVAARTRRLDLGAGRSAVQAAGGLTGALRPPRQCVVDGRMGPCEWVRVSEGLLKVDYEEHGFDATGRRVTDPAYDLAAAAIGFRLETEEERRLVESYSRLTGDSRDLPVRLAYHRLLAGTEELRALSRMAAGLGTPADCVAFARELAVRETLLTRTVHDYLAAVLLDGLTAEASGAVWALDVEGVLETRAPGFDSASPAGVLALRVLLAHGCRVLLCAGLSLGELRERCRVFGLAGGVAEGGSVAWDASRQASVDMVGASVREHLRRLRGALTEQTDVLADPRYQHSLCLYRYDARGRRPVPAAEVRAMAQRLGLRGLEVTVGPSATTVRASGVDRAGAVDGLRRTLAGGAAIAPLHVAGADERQSGLLQVVRRATHGRRGSCERCALPRLGEADAAFVRMLGLQDRGS